MAETAGGRSEVWAVRLERANIWGLGEMRGHEAPVTCRTLSMTRNLDLCLTVEGKNLLKHYRLV